MGKIKRILKGALKAVGLYEPLANMRRTIHEKRFGKKKAQFVQRLSGIEHKVYSPGEIVALYNAHVVKEPTYYTKWRDFRAHLIDGRFGNFDPAGHDASRIFCLFDFKEWISKYRIRSKNALFTWVTDPEIEFLPHERMTAIPYHAVTNRNDLHTLDLPCKTYDFVLFSQTLEHLYDPFISVWNLREHMRSGGYIFTSVPTLNIPHMTPFHFQHLTPMGLVMLFKRAGFDVVELGVWGNLDYATRVLSTYDWPDIYAVSSENDPKHPAQCWILARKV